MLLTIALLPSYVFRAAVVEGKGISSYGHVLGARRVEQKGCRAHCGIGIRVVEYQRPSANSGIEVAGRIQEERTPTQSRISSTGSEKTNCVAPFRCRKIRIAPGRCGTDCLNLCQKTKE